MLWTYVYIRQGTETEIEVLSSTETLVDFHHTAEHCIPEGTNLVCIAVILACKS
jgi:hypothetical protein